MSNVIIRNFRRDDREIVRTICCDTADKGEPIERFLPDRDAVSELLTGYYTDYEPDALFVAEADGKVVGYVMGSFDNRRYGLVMFWILVPKALLKGFKRGLFFRPEFWQLGLGMLRNWRRLFAWRKESFHSHQGHMHIGIAKGFRGQHVGQRLVAALLDYARSKGVDELTASVHDGNKAASGFFTHLEFEMRESYPMVMVQKNQEEHYHSLLYVKKII